MQTLTPITAEAVVAAVRSLRVAQSASEAKIHHDLMAAFRRREVGFVHEHVLGPGNRVDFWIPACGVVVEVKKGKPSSTATVLRQAERYAAFPEVQAVVLCIEGKLSLNQDTVNGKPVHYVSLAKQWGLAL